MFQQDFAFLPRLSNEGIWVILRPGDSAEINEIETARCEESESWGLVQGKLAHVRLPLLDALFSEDEYLRPASSA